MLLYFKYVGKFTNFVLNYGNMYPKISIITVVRNDAEGLEATLDNLEQLRYENLEVIVIDGASTDSTPRVAAAHMHLIAHYVSEPDRGIYDAMNKGLRVATGEYVWFVNAGDKVVDFDALHRLFVNDVSLADIYYGDTRIVSSEGEILGLRRKPLPDTLTVNSLKRGMVVCHQSFVVRREIAPLYNLKYRYSSDVQWIIDCLKAAETVCNTHAVLSEFRLGGATTAHRKDSLIERWRIMCRTFGFFTTFFAHIHFIFDAFTTPRYR